MTKPKTDKPESQKLNTQRLNEMVMAYKQSGILFAGLELELFTKISEGPAEPAEIAEKIGIPAESADRLMIACVAIGLLEKRGGKYVNAPDVEKYFVKGRRTYFGDSRLHFGRGSYDQWKDITGFLRSSLPPSETGYTDAMQDPEAARITTTAQYNSSISMAHKLAREFDFSPYSLWLDLGGGPGAYCIAAASRYAHLRAIVFDLPNVVSVAEEFIARAGLSDRVKTYGGDLLKDEYPRGADLISYNG